MVIVREPGLNGFEWGKTLNKVKLDKTQLRIIRIFKERVMH